MTKSKYTKKQKEIHMALFGEDPDEEIFDMEGKPKKRRGRPPKNKENASSVSISQTAENNPMVAKFLSSFGCNAIYSDDFRCFEEYDENLDSDNPLYKEDNLSVAEYIQKIKLKENNFDFSSASSDSFLHENKELYFGTKWYKLTEKKPLLFKRPRGRRSKVDKNRFISKIEV
jgi:hypothetical protein